MRDDIRDSEGIFALFAGFLFGGFVGFGLAAWLFS